MEASRGTERLRSETDFHDRQARARAASFAAEHSYHFEDAEYLQHESWIQPALAHLGDVHGLRVLDYGCGHGMAAVVLARAGAHVTGFDLSHGYAHEARRRASANGVDVHFVQANAEQLPFADGSFDRVWGNAILHHLDVQQAGQELKRILQPHGLAVFCEPWGENRLLNWARRGLPYPGKERTPDEKPLRNTQVATLCKIFPRVEIEGFQFLAMARRLVGQNSLSRGLDWCDQRLLKRAPHLQRYCRYVVIRLQPT